MFIGGAALCSSRRAASYAGISGRSDPRYLASITIGASRSRRLPEPRTTRTVTVQLPGLVSSIPSTCHTPSESCEATRVVGFPAMGAVSVSVTSRASSVSRSSFQRWIVAFAMPTWPGSIITSAIPFSPWMCWKAASAGIVRAAASEAASTPVIASSRTRGMSCSGPGRRGNQMQDVCGWMKKAFDASAADGVTGPG
jgi:hypothetical protein